MQSENAGASGAELMVYFIDDDRHILQSVGQTLELEGLQVETFLSAEEALRNLQTDWPGVLVSDINMPGMDGLQLMQALQKVDSETPVILVTGHGDISTAVSAMREGAYDFIEKPFSNERLLDTIRRAMDKRRLTLENRDLRRELQEQNAPGPRILGRTPAIQRLRRVLQQIMNTPADILLFGETGVGKELVARYLHEHSNRREHNFVAINCGAVPENLIESELFGHEAGAFTGADKRRIGKFEHANGGTLFLDEIESMPLSLQVKILRVLEERKVERLGSNTLIPLDLRVIAATKISLKEMADRGEFRSDLYYRLNTVAVEIPSLQDRLEDVPLLFEHFALVAAARYQQEIVPLKPEQRHRLLTHNWPGNVRELRNLAERYVIMGEECSFDMEHMLGEPEIQSRRTLTEKVELYEQTLIREALAAHHGSIKDSLVALGLPRKTLYDKMKKYGISRQDFRESE
ncbi:sigma 54-dependent transcriptional activator containing CheY-like receiver domain [Hahella chejuensis KCTC 2396]|uniref:Sigma 54-dependent transcriptional activator containing CheY-like receiver domain n=1 Tax=Hahella chejuensis (strain KCTC 2396) TaxID=349521 RepID=Q2SQ36_HAHCH|nr:sigma 54-dependent transcriptional activator containing CheY-like receiver domain [Hahella chejuensis KCTC 2396]